MSLKKKNKTPKWVKKVERSDPRKAFPDGGGWVPLALSPAHRSKAAFGLLPKAIRVKIHVGPTKVGEVRAKNVRASRTLTPETLP